MYGSMYSCVCEPHTEAGGAWYISDGDETKYEDGAEPGRSGSGMAWPPMELGISSSLSSSINCDSILLIADLAFLNLGLDMLIKLSRT